MNNDNNMTPEQLQEAKAQLRKLIKERVVFPVANDVDFFAGESFTATFTAKSGDTREERELINSYQAFKQQNEKNPNHDRLYNVLQSDTDLLELIKDGKTEAAIERMYSTWSVDKLGNIVAEATVDTEDGPVTLRITGMDLLETIFNLSTAAAEPDPSIVEFTAVLLEAFMKFYGQKEGSAEGLETMAKAIYKLIAAMRIERSSAESLEEIIPEITAIAKLERIDFPLDKPNSWIWSRLSQTDATGQLAFDVANEKDSRKGKHVDIIYSINFDALGDDLPQAVKRLTVYDKRVYVSIAGLFNAGGSIVSPTQIYHGMGYSGRCGAADIQKILTSIKKMAKAWVYINNSQEVEVYKRYMTFDYDGYLLPCELRPAYINGKYTDTAILIYREPPLITFARQRKQITTLSVALLQSPVSKTDANMRIEDYLLERISRAQNEDDRKKRPEREYKSRILYKTLYERCGIPAKPKNAMLIRADVTMTMGNPLNGRGISLSVILSLRNERSTITIQYPAAVANP